MRRFPPAVLILLASAGCADTGGHYPSLAPRAAEKQGFEEPAIAPVAVAPDPALDARLAAKAAELDRIAAGFTAAAGAARHAAEAAAHQPVGGEAWLTAQAALARIDDWRAQATALAAEVEAEGSARAATLLPAYPAIDGLRARAAAEADREATVAAELQALLPAA